MLRHTTRCRPKLTLHGAAGLVFGVVLAGCGSDDSALAPTTTAATTAIAVTTPTPASPAPTSTPVPASTTAATVAAEPLRLLVLGDSIAIPSMGCGDCVGFDEQYRSYVEQVTGQPVELHNDARPEAQIRDLQALLDSDPAVQAEVAAADVVVVSIGYNNGPPWSPDEPCHPLEAKVDTELLIMLRDFTDECIAATNESFRDDFDGVYARIEELAADRPQLRIDLGNFNNLLGNPGGDGTLPKVWAGEDAPGFSQNDMPTAVANMTTAIVGFNEAECETATAHGFVCAGLYHAFNGQDGAASLAEFVNPADFVHPNEQGQAVIAQLLQQIDLGPILA